MIRWLNVKQPEPERYFQSDFLERFTFFRLSTVWMIWGPVFLLALFGSFYTGGRSLVGGTFNFFLVALAIIVIFALGLIRWSLLEYFLHRFPFHYDGPNEFRKRISWYVHGIHHQQAMLRTRLVAPPPFSLIIGLVIAAVDWLILGLLFRAGWVGLALYSGTVLGYLLYDTLHWCVHFIDADWKWYRKLRSHHMRHHRFPQGRFGVSNTLWDHVFQTYPKSKEGEEAKAMAQQAAQTAVSPFDDE